jgi:PAS domain-containing protein
VLDNALQGRETANFEFPLYTKDQRRVDVLLNATTRRDVSGNVVGVLGVGQDITERKQVEVEKTRVAQELQTFIDTANAPIFGIDAFGSVNEWNNKSAAITGFSREEVLGKNLVQVRSRIHQYFFILTLFSNITNICTRILLLKNTRLQ